MVKTKLIKEYLVAKNKTQAELAQLLARDKSAVSLLLQGKRQLKVNELLAIADWLEVSPMALLGRDDVAAEQVVTAVAQAEKDMTRQMTPVHHLPYGPKPIVSTTKTLKQETLLQESKPDLAPILPLTGDLSLLDPKHELVVWRDGYPYFRDEDWAVPGREALIVPDQSLELEGFMSGDLVVINRKRRPQKDDVVVVVIDATPQKQWVLRKYQPPFLRVHSVRDSFEQLHEDRQNIVIYATVERLIRRLHAATSSISSAA